jgi:spore maturation protein CgeB
MRRVLISGAFNDDQYKFGFFNDIAEAIEHEGMQVERFNSFAFNRPNSLPGKLLERIFTLPGRLLGIDKQSIRSALPWTPEGQRERALISAVRRFHPDTLIVIRGFMHTARTLQLCRKLGVKNLVGWYVEGPLEPGAPEAESLLFDRYYCIHNEIDPLHRQRINWLPSYGLDTRNFSRLRWPRTPKNKIVFVGTATDRRVRFLEALRSLPLELWGPKWSKIGTLAQFHRGDFIWGPQLNELYNESAIVLNIASWDSHLSGMTQRVIEIPASGAFMLSDNAAEVKALFEPGIDMDVFDTPGQLASLCERYLANAGLREKIADQGHRRALQHGDFSFAAKVLIGLSSAPLFTKDIGPK